MKPVKPSLLVTAAFSIALVAIAVFNSQTSSAHPNQPGREVKVINGPTEPVPVSLPSGASVKVSNFPSFPSFPSSVASSRQNWEYTVVNARTGQLDQLLADLKRLGNEGWEVVGIGVGPMLPAGAGGTPVLLKRPK